MKKLGLYVHIPFCERKCNYCDFYSVSKSDIVEKQYIKALLEEIKSYKNISKDYVVDSIFIGGGTPSYLNHENIGLILDEIKNIFILSDDIEVTMEANPNSITLDKVINYKKYGINRMSVGIQSLDKDILKIIGRLHNSKEALEAIDTIKKAGINNINVDIMFNIPGQELSSIQSTLKQVIDKDIEHISFYSLKLEEGTPMYKMEESGIIKMVDDDIERNMYYEGRELMENNGYYQYEISNFSKPGYECRHNIKYWTGGEYIGFGPFAHSCFKDNRFNNISDIKRYCENMNEPNKYRHLNEVLDKESKMFEYIMLRLRMNSGFIIEDFNGEFNIDFMKKYKNQIDSLLKYQLIDIDNGKVKLTKKGMDVSNYVFEEFLLV